MLPNYNGFYRFDKYIINFFKYSKDKHFHMIQNNHVFRSYFESFVYLINTLYVSETKGHFIRLIEDIKEINLRDKADV